MRSVPGFAKLILMYGGPLDDQAPGTSRKSALQYKQIVYVYQGSVPAVARVEVGRAVFPKVDVYDDAVESADLRHPVS